MGFKDTWAEAQEQVKNDKRPWYKKKTSWVLIVLALIMFASCGNDEERAVATAPAPVVSATASPSPIVTPAPYVAPSPVETTVAPTTAPPAPVETKDPRFSSCAKANANGYSNYIKGVDPEYDWYQDRDGDGKVCEPEG